jgi:hypothetical protein
LDNNVRLQEKASAYPAVRTVLPRGPEQAPAPWSPLTLIKALEAWDDYVDITRQE